MKSLVNSIKGCFRGNTSSERLPTVESMDSLLPPQYCSMQIALARNHDDPESLLEELRTKKDELKRRIEIVEQQEAQEQKVHDDRQTVNGGRMTVRDKLLVAGFIATFPISAPVAAAYNMCNAFRGSAMMKHNLAFLETLEQELVRSQKRKDAIAVIDKELDAEMAATLTN